MKKIYFLLTVIAGFLFFLLNSAMPTEDSKYYYAFEEKIPLIPKENTLLIKYVNGFNKTEAKEFLKAEISSGFKEKWHSPQTVEITMESEK